MWRRWIVTLAAVSGWQDSAGQSPGEEWRIAPARPTVGDTVWLERRFALPPGWRLRPGRLDGGDAIEPLGEPTVYRAGEDRVVRYPVTAWTPGSHTVSIPPVWRLGPDAQADSVLGGTARFVVQAVIPDTTTAPAPKPALAPLRSARRDLGPVLLAFAAATTSLAAGLWWRRRAPRRLDAAPARALKPEVADARWLDAGEMRAVAARAAGRLRRAVAAAVPAAHPGLSTADCLALVQRAHPQAFPELAVVLEGLEQVAFATAPKADVASLAERAQTLVGALER
jgi:hypothetical protein